VNTVLRWFVVLFTTLLLQTTLVARLPLFQERGDIVLLIVIAAAIVGGPQLGSVIGFVFGLSFDLMLQTPLGLSALTYCITGYAIGALQSGVLRTTWWIPVLSAVAGSAIGVVTFALLGDLLGQDGLVSGRLAAIIGAVAIINAVLVHPALRVVRWATAPSRQARLQAR
jgi:rod shape-determining protein MreD